MRTSCFTILNKYCISQGLTIAFASLWKNHWQSVRFVGAHSPKATNALALRSRTSCFRTGNCGPCARRMVQPGFAWSLKSLTAWFVSYLRIVGIVGTESTAGVQLGDEEYHPASLPLLNIYGSTGCIMMVRWVSLNTLQRREALLTNRCLLITVIII